MLFLTLLDAPDALRETVPAEVLRDAVPEEGRACEAELLRVTVPVLLCVLVDGAPVLRDTVPAELLRETVPAELLRDTEPVELLRETEPADVLREAEPDWRV